MSIAALLSAIRDAPVIPAAIWTPPSATYPSRVLGYGPTHYWRLGADGSDLGSAPATLTNINSVPFGRPTLVVDSSSGASASFNGSSATPGRLSATGAVSGMSACTFGAVSQVDKHATKQIVFHVKDVAFPGLGSDSLGIELVDNNTAGLRLRIYRWAGAALRVFLGPVAGFPIGTPAHLAVRFGTDGSCAAFVDGSEVALTPSGAIQPASWPPFTDDTLYLSGWQNGGDPFDGLMAEAFIFSTALSDAAILDMHGPTRKVAQVVWLSDFSVGQLTASSGSIDPAAQPTTHPAIGLTTIKDSNPATGTVAISGGVWTYTSGTASAAFSFTGRVSKGAITSSPARTISGTWPATAPTAGSVISLPPIEFLVSDEAVPSPTGGGSTIFVDNAAELTSALSGAGPGDVIVARCATPGTIEYWNLPNGISFPSGSSGNPITLQAREGDGVVISAAETFAGARTPNSGFWTQNSSLLTQADKDAGIWVSAASFGSETADVLGVWYEFGHPHFLVPYGSLQNLRAPYNSTARNPPSSASGAGVDLDNGRLYIRWIRPHPGKNSGGNKWKNHNWPGHPEAYSGGQIAYPVSLNPNDYVIHVYRANQSERAFDMTAGAGGGFVKIGSGINSLGFKEIIRGHDITMRRGTDIAFRYFLSSASTSNNFSNYDVQRRRIAQGSMRHLSRDDFKFFDASGGRTGWLEGSYRQAFVEIASAPFTINNLYFKDCTITDWHEWFVGRVHRIRFLNCSLFNLLDDGWQIVSDAHHLEIGYCFMLHTPLGGNDQGLGNNTSDTGQIFIHHNIMDNRCQKCSSWGNDTFPPFMWLNHSATGVHPRKNYNNTLFWGPDTEDQQSFGFQHNANNDNTATGTQKAHEVFNNIFVRIDTQRYIPTSVGSPSTAARSDWAGSHISCDADRSNEFWDFNLYYRDIPQISGSQTHQLLFKVRNGKNSGETGFDTISAFKSSGLFTTSKSSGSLRGSYSPGFENSGTNTAPTMLSISNFPTDRFKYRPTSNSAVTTATASSLSGANWWSTPPSWGTAYFGWSGLAPSAYKGALDPAGSTMPIGVQTP